MSQVVNRIKAFTEDLNEVPWSDIFLFNAEFQAKMLAMLGYAGQGVEQPPVSR